MTSGFEELDLPPVAPRHPVAPAPRLSTPSTLVDAALPVFQMVLLLYGKAPREPGRETFRSAIKARLDEVRRSAERLRLREKESKLAEYALVAFIDEMVAHSSWSGSDGWRKLELELFQTAIGGDAFFDNLHSDIDDSMTHALQICFCCIQLGFEGGLRTLPDGARRLDAERTRLRERLRLQHLGDDDAGRLFPEAYAQLRTPALVQRAQGHAWLIAAGCCTLAALVLYGVCWLLLDADAARAAAALRGGP